MISFKVLGALEIRREGVPARLEASMQRRVLAVLLARVGQIVSVDTLLDSLWPGTPPRTARKTVQIYVHRLRTRLGLAESITYGAGGYRLTVPVDAMDATRFEEMVRHARVARSAGEFTVARGMLQNALDLWRGPPFADFPDLTVAQSTVQRLTERRLVACEERTELDLILGRHAELACDLRPLIAEHPYQDRLREYLMIALYRSGRSAAALEVYHETRRLYGNELGIQPGRRLQDLHQAVLRAEPFLDWSTDPASRRPPPGIPRWPGPTLQPGAGFQGSPTNAGLVMRSDGLAERSQWG